MLPEFKHYDLSLVAPEFDSPLTDLIIDLDYLRRNHLRGSTPPFIFFQIKNIFHTLESIGSARIEGNRTTLAEYIESKLSSNKTGEEKFIEIQNVENAMDFIDENIRDYSINASFLRQMHLKTVENLSPKNEGDATPGEYRTKNPSISGSVHRPPDYTQVPTYMDGLFEFINAPSEPKYDLLKTAITHHRFVWIHPFHNGNGRTVRLLTYAMLIKQGFNIDVGRIINPTAVFCNDRNKYYHFLSLADSGKNENILQWCEYVLAGLKKETEKIDKLLDYDFLSSKILKPSVSIALHQKIITELEAKILRVAIEKETFQASDIKHFFQGKAPMEISRAIRRLKAKDMLFYEKTSSRKYGLRFNNNYLLRGIIAMLGENNFLPPEAAR